MAKELLIVEEPIVCDMCWLSVQKAKGVYCRYKHRYNEEHKKPTWCPLKPMPKKTGQKPYCRTKQECVNLGWDACIDEINKSDLGTDEGWWRDYELYEMQTD